jgi:colicin import membrane protein
MKIGPILVIAALTVTAAGLRAQTSADAAFRDYLERQRARIAIERADAEARHTDAERGCYRRFAVNDCLNEIRAARRSVLADLRRQEILLNSEERKRKAGEALQRLERQNP